MKYAAVFCSALVAMLVIAFAVFRKQGMTFVDHTEPSQVNRLPHGRDILLANAESAAKHAYSKLVANYGKKAVDAHMPLNVEFRDGTWTIVGTFPYGKAVGGTFTIVLRPEDGTILSLNHGK
jgi:hypothetical protein